MAEPFGQIINALQLGLGLSRANLFVQSVLFCSGCSVGWSCVWDARHDDDFFTFDIQYSNFGGGDSENSYT